jgi:hypothetical protein
VIGHLDEFTVDIDDKSKTKVRLFCE